MLHEPFRVDHCTAYIEVLFVNAWLHFIIYLVFLYQYIDNIDTNM